MPTWDRLTAPAPAIAFLKSREKLELHAYYDGSKAWSIGYGACLDLANHPVTAGTRPITEAQADQLLVRDLRTAVGDVAVSIRVPLTLGQAGALVIFAFNLGRPAVAAASLCVLVNNQQWLAAAERFAIYRNSGGKPVVGLVRRRWCEAAIFLGADASKVWAQAERKIDSLDDWPPLPPIAAA
jgi:lysozyme